MWIWDTMPSWGYRPKKPLTKAQIRKMQEAYKNADTITAHVKALEKQEAKNAEEELKSLDIV
jgi:hypothetical protein